MLRISNCYDFSREYEWEKAGIAVVGVDGIMSVCAWKTKPALGTSCQFSFSGQ